MHSVSIFSQFIHLIVHITYSMILGVMTNLIAYYVIIIKIGPLIINTCIVYRMFNGYFTLMQGLGACSFKFPFVLTVFTVCHMFSARQIDFVAPSP